MDFGVTKCAKLAIRKGKVVATEGIKLPDGREIKNLEKGDSYKYLGELELDEVQCKDMKMKLTKEYFWCARKLLRSKIDEGNMICGINTWAVSVLRYSASFVNWTRDELRVLDRKTRKYLTMYGALHARDSVARIYLPRKKGGRGLISIEDCVDQAVIGLSSYNTQSNSWGAAHSSDWKPPQPPGNKQRVQDEKNWGKDMWGERETATQAILKKYGRSSKWK